MTDIKNCSLQEVESVLKDWHEPLYHAKQIFSWLYQRGACSFDAMTNLSASLRSRLTETFAHRAIALITLQESRDGTRKFLFRLEDGSLVESVVIPARGRNTVCLSSQVGCKYACDFCASGLLGFKRNLKAWEILAQLLAITHTHRGGAGRVTHVVFMGTGEPLDNYDNVLKAIRIINSKEGFGIGARRITVSTSGIIPGIKRLASEGLQIELSVSLHSADSLTRSRLMPVNKKYPLNELIAACKKYAVDTNRQVTFEYALLKGINCSQEAAQDIIRLLKGWNAKVNLLIYNPVKELPYKAPDKGETEKFSHALIRAGLVVTLRKSRGQDIEGACGQLRIKRGEATH